MNDFDDIIAGAVGSRADGAPTDVPEFGGVLADRQSRLRRRTAVAAIGLVAVGVTGIAAFAVGGADTPSTADGPVPSDQVALLPTTIPGVPIEGTGGETIWFCQGAVDPVEAALPTTTIAPPATTTIAPPATTGAVAAEPEPTTTFVEERPPLEDSGYFRDCRLLVGGPTETYVDQYPTTTTFVVAPDPGPDSGTGASPGADAGSYVVQTGDYGIKVADQFCVPLEALLDANGWSTGNEFPFPGNIIQIPPGGCDPVAVSDLDPD